jgi:hypothetical protein
MTCKTVNDDFSGALVLTEKENIKKERAFSSALFSLDNRLEI